MSVSSLALLSAFTIHTQCAATNQRGDNNDKHVEEKSESKDEINDDYDCHKPIIKIRL